jgi:very-short-patch-repair endonuclease
VLTGPQKTVQRARKQRQHMSLPEVLLWQVLRGSPEGIRFRRLQPSGQLVSDFFCHKAGLVIEIDGESHNRGDQPEFDATRDAWLRANGLVVQRIAAKDVLGDLDAVYRLILAKAHELKAVRESAPRPIPPFDGQARMDCWEQSSTARVARSDGGVPLPANRSQFSASLSENVTPLRQASPATSPLRGGSTLEHRP